eukprot:10082528-Alexandrium_andersonii.AAC.1
MCLAPSIDSARSASLRSYHLCAFHFFPPGGPLSIALDSCSELIRSDAVCSFRKGSMQLAAQLYW